MKRLLYLILILLSFNSYSQSAIDSLSSIDQFGRVRDGIIAQNIIDVLNTDPSGIKLTENEKQYIRTIVNGLYTTGVWEKCKAVYGFVGGNEWKHKWNWKDMRDLDVAFRLQFFGGLTHNSSGVTPNGTTGYANTFLVTSTNTTGLTMGYYTNQNLAATALEYVMGSANGTLSTSFNNSLIIRRSTNSSIFLGTGYATSPNSRVDANVTDSRGFTLGTIQTQAKLFQNGRLIGTNTAFTPSVKSNVNTFLFAYNAGVGVAYLFTNKPCQLALIGDFFTDTEAIQASNIITFAQSILNRQ